MDTSSEAEPESLRARFRTQVREEIKVAALRQLSEGGPEAVSLNAIAKELGVSGAALYRYFTSRNDLFTELILDTYTEVHTAIAAAASNPDLPQAERLHACGRAYRRFALAQPHRYRLLFTPPVQGYDAHAQRLAEAAHALMLVLFKVFGEVRSPTGPPGPPVSGHLADQLRTWTISRGGDPVPTSTALRGLATWSRLHGFISLELGGVYRAMQLDADQLFDHELDALAPSTNATDARTPTHSSSAPSGRPKRAPG